MTFIYSPYSFHKFPEPGTMQNMKQTTNADNSVTLSWDLPSTLSIQTPPQNKKVEYHQESI